MTIMNASKLKSYAFYIFAILFNLFFITLYVSKIAKNDVNPYYAVIGIITLLLCAAFSFFLLFIIKTKSLSLEKIWIFFALGFGIFRIFTITPLSPFDEIGHYEHAYRESNVLLFKFSDLNYMTKEHHDFSNFKEQNNVASAYERWKDPFFIKGTEASENEREKQETFNPFQYLMQAFGISIARILHFNLMPLYFLGRLCNLLFYVFCLYFAIRLIPFGKLTMFVIGLLPLCLHLPSSFSNDGYIFAVSFLLFALLIKSIFNQEKITLKEMILLAIFSFILAPSKLVYIPISCLCILIPSKRFSNLKQNISVKTLLIFAGIVSILIFNGSRILNLSGSEKLTYTGEPCYSLSDFLHNPLKFVLVYLNTLRYLWSDWISEAMGVVLMGVPTGIPVWLRFLFLALLFITTFLSVEELKSTQQITFSGTQKLFSFILLLGSVLLIMTAELFIWTPKGASQIAGVQGRYFLPYFPLFFFAVRNKVFATTIPIEKYVCIIEIFMQFYIVFMTVNQTL